MQPKTTNCIPISWLSHALVAVYFVKVVVACNASPGLSVLPHSDEIWVGGHKLPAGEDTYIFSFRSHIYNMPLYYYRARIIVATIQSLRSVQQVDRGFFDVVIADEGHHMEKDSTWTTWYNYWDTPYRVLLTASMLRLKGTVGHNQGGLLLRKAFYSAAFRKVLRFL